MGRNLSPVLRRELANLEKDSESRKSAMKALKSYVKELDSKAIPQFLAQVSETKDPVSMSGEYTISLYEVLARVHGRNIVPQIDNIISTVINTLKASAGLFPLHQACSKVVPAIARYGIDPTTPDLEKKKIIYSLCKPLSDVLMGPPETLASGSALCLKALVESDNWRFASDDIVNDVCLKVAGALEETLTQTNAHMGLAMALAKHNSLILEAYARSLLRSGLRILTDSENNSQKRLEAAQMINFLMKWIDIGSTYSELETIIEVMERCQSDRMPFVSGAAFETLQTARVLASDKGWKQKGSSSITGSNFGSSRRNLWGSRSPRNSRSPRYASPESHTVDSAIRYDSFAESPMSAGQVSCNLGGYGKPVNRKLWSDNSGVDVSLKDGLYSKISHENVMDEEISDNRRDVQLFAGFLHSSPTFSESRSLTPSPERHSSHLCFDDIKIFPSPRKLHSLQDPSKETEPSETGDGVLMSKAQDVELSSSKNLSEDDPNCLLYESKHKNDSRTGSSSDPLKRHVESNESECISSANYILDNGCGDDDVPEISLNINTNKTTRFAKFGLKLACGLSLILSAVFWSSMSIENQENYVTLFPT